jgi:hypothetical protein
MEDLKQDVVRKIGYPGLIILFIPTIINEVFSSHNLFKTRYKVFSKFKSESSWRRGEYASLRIFQINRGAASSIREKQKPWDMVKRYQNLYL